ncbi:hypothetical protein [Sphingomonas spermidinifaciens]|nr:hypothetical protein [Sphingomonas spermidinifaciens]
MFDFIDFTTMLTQFGPSWNDAASVLVVALALGLGVAVELLRPR